MTYLYYICFGCFRVRWFGQCSASPTLLWVNLSVDIYNNNNKWNFSVDIYIYYNNKKIAYNKCEYPWLTLLRLKFCKRIHYDNKILPTINVNLPNQRENTNTWWTNMELYTNTTFNQKMVIKWSHNWNGKLKIRMGNSTVKFKPN